MIYRTLQFPLTCSGSPFLSLLLEHFKLVHELLTSSASSADLSGRNRQDVQSACTKALDYGITKIRYDVYSAYIRPVIMYSADVLSLTVASQRWLDAFDHSQYTQPRSVNSTFAQELRSP